MWHKAYMTLKLGRNSKYSLKQILQMKFDHKHKLRAGFSAANQSSINVNRRLICSEKTGLMYSKKKT